MKVLVPAGIHGAGAAVLLSGVPLAWYAAATAGVVAAIVAWPLLRRYPRALVIAGILCGALAALPAVFALVALVAAATVHVARHHRRA